MKILGLNLNPKFNIRNNVSKPQELTQAQTRGELERKPNKDTVSFGKHYQQILVDTLDANGAGLYISRLKRLPNIPCAYCAEKMLSPKMHNKLANDMAHMRGRKLADSIMVNLKFFRGAMRDIAYNIAEMARLRPKLDTPELIRGYCSEIKYQHALDLLSGKAPNPDKYSHMEWFVIKNATKPAREFFGKLLVGAMATTEHIRPRVRGGKNDISNLCVVCSSCNASRGNKRLEAFAEEVPDLVQNIKTQFDYLMPFPLLDSEKYVRGIANTFMFESGGKLDLSSYVQK